MDSDKYHYSFEFYINEVSLESCGFILSEAISSELGRTGMILSSILQMRELMVPNLSMTL